MSSSSSQETSKEMSSSSSQETSKPKTWKPWCEYRCHCGNVIVHRDDVGGCYESEYLTDPHSRSPPTPVFRVPRISLDKVDISTPSDPTFATNNVWFIRREEERKELTRHILCKQCGKKIGDFYCEKNTQNVEDRRALFKRGFF